MLLCDLTHSNCTLDKGIIVANISFPPIQEPMGTRKWIDWFIRVNREVDAFVNAAWSNIDFTGSNITDIISRAHNNLQSFDGGTTGERYHLTSAEHTALTGNSVSVPSTTVAGAPSASTEGAAAIIYVSDEAGGATLAFSDGTNWRRVQDRAVIS